MLIGAYNSNDLITRNNLGPNTIPSLGFHSNNTMGEFASSISNLAKNDIFQYCFFLNTAERTF